LPSLAILWVLLSRTLGLGGQFGIHGRGIRATKVAPIEITGTSEQMLTSKF